MEQGYLKDVNWKHFDGGNFCVVDQPQYPSSQVEANHREAEKLYDKAFRNRYLYSAEGSMQSIKTEAPEEILVFRCSRMWQIDGIITALKKRFPKSKISILGQPEIAEKLKQNQIIYETFFYDNTHFDNKKFPQHIIDQLKKRKFALGVIPYNNMTGNGYGEVTEIARRMDIKKLVGINIQSKIFHLFNGKVIKS